MGFCALANVIALRNNLSVAIVAMVNATEEENADVHQADVCPERSRHSSTAPSVRNFICCFKYISIG